MRIISGLARGIQLKAPEGRDVRPTEDKVKESIFGTLGDIQGKRVLDLFSGTGALGLEALSRGASQVFFVESNKKHIDFIEQNRAAVVKSMNGQAGETKILCADAKDFIRFLPQWTGMIDLILADPPYATPQGAYGANQLLLDAFLAQWAGTQTLLVLEHSTDHYLPWEEAHHWRFIKEKSFGIRTVSFAIREEDE